MMTPSPASIAKTISRLLLLLAPLLPAQTTTGAQSVAFAGIRTAASLGQWNAVKADASGNIYLLMDQRDGVRILKCDSTASTVLSQAQFGARGDIGLSLALDPSGNVYVAGTTTSTVLTATPAAAFPARTDSSTNSFVAKFDADLNPLFVTFAGSGRMAASSVAATADAVFLTGSLFAATLPVTPDAILQTPASGSQQNGFVERFSADGSTLVYATYLTGALGDTAPTSIVADAADNAYVAGSTSASGYPTVAALVPRIQPPSSGTSPSSGFLTKLSPRGDAIAVSTFIPGAGITSLALDPAPQNLLLSGTVALGQFPITNAPSPLVAASYQVLLRLPLDASSVIASTVIAPGTQSFVTPAPNGGAWVDGQLSTPLLPLTALANIGGSFAVRVTADGTIDQTARFGGLAATDPNYAAAPVVLTSLTTDPSGQPLFAGAFIPTSSASLLATERYDLPLTQPPTPVFPSAVVDTPVATCSGSLCPGSAAYLAKLSPGTNAASLLLSTGTSPDIVLRNLGSAQAENVQVTATGFTMTTTCGSTLPAGAECAIALSDSGPGTLIAQASNGSTQTAALPATSASPTPIAFSPRELDFGVQTANSAPIQRTLTIANVSQQTQTFVSSLDYVAKNFTSPFSQTSTDCPPANTATMYTLPPGGTCHIILSFSLTSSTPDGPVQYPWTIAVSGTHDVLLTGYAQSASLSLSATRVEFGTQFVAGLRSSRSLFLSNHSDTAIPHRTVTLPASSPFAVSDLCPGTLPPHSICRLQFTYNSRISPTEDSTTLSLDDALTVLVTGQTLPQPGTSGTAVNPNLAVTPTAITFLTPVPVTGKSNATQTVNIANTGTSPFSLNLNLTGDFSQTTTCGNTLADNTSCSVSLVFTPTEPGPRDGLLAITAGAGSAPVYVTLTGTAISILAGNNGTLAFASVPVGQPVVQWYKVTQSFPQFAATATGPWKVFLSEDIGYGHASPAPSAFLTTATGTCFNCYLGVQYQPSTAGDEAGSLALTSGSSATPYVLTLTGTGLPVTGLLLSPATQDFGTLPLHSTSQPFLFALTNLTGPLTPVTLTAPDISGDFALSSAPTGGPACSGTLAVAVTCYVQLTFSPTATGPRTGSLTFQTASGTATANLTGYGSPDPGIAFSPNALIFQNVPGPASTVQAVTVTNTGSSAITFGPPATNSPAFTASSTCATLAPAATCTAIVSYLPGGALTSGVLSLPVTALHGGTPTLTTYTVPLNGAYTSQTAGLQILPNLTDFGPSPVDGLGFTRTFTLNNLTAKPATLTLSLPRQFALTTPSPCAALAANGSCTVTVTYLPSTSGAATGTIYAQATPTDGSAPLSGLAYLQGYASPIFNGTLTVTGPLSPGTGLLDFGQVASGQSASRVLTLTNTGPASSPQITIRRTTSQPPFLSTTTCGSPLHPGESCAITLTYTGINQVPSGSTPTPATPYTGTITIESDASTSPTIINLTGSVTPTQVTTPSNSVPIHTYTLSQGSLTFPATSAGNVSPAQTIVLTNTGNADLHLLSLKTSSDFTVTSDCVQGISTCTLTVTFTPQLQGQATAVRSATLQVATDSGTSLEFVSLFGLSASADLSIQPTRLDFGAVNIGRSASLAVQVNNPGATPVVFSSVTATGDYTPSGNCPASGASLAAAARCTIQVLFTPASVGNRTGTLSIASSASTLPLTVALTGVGAQAQLQAAPSSLNFGAVPLSQSASLTIRVSNPGAAPIVFNGITATGDYTPSGNCPSPGSSLAAGANCTVQVMFSPAALGSRAGTLSIATSASPLTVALAGVGTQSRLQVAPASLNFGSVALGASDGLSLTLTNSGSAPITSVALSIAGDYAITVPCSSTSLTPGQSCSVSVNFTPTTAGARSGALLITSSDPGSPVTIPLSGTGIQDGSFLLTVDGASTSSATVRQGFPAAYTLTVTPTGNFTGDVVLHCTPLSPIQFAGCSILPSSLTLANLTPQNAILTITTVTSVQRAAITTGAGRVLLCLLPPIFFVGWRRRRRFTLAAAMLLLGALLPSGCGGGANPNLRYTPPGTYQYQVTANSTSGVQIAQSVTVTLNVTN